MTLAEGGISVRLRGRRTLTTLGALMAIILAILALAWVSLHRPDIPFEALQARYGAPESRYLDLSDGAHVHLRDVGPRTGVPIVLVHGYAASDRDWDDWIARLSTTHRVVALDLPGHGLTRTPADYHASNAAFVQVVDRVAAALELPPFVLVGNSMGGAVAWRYALVHPDRLRGLVLVDAAGWLQRTKAGEKASGTDAIVFELLNNPVGRKLLAELDVTPFARQGLQSAFIDRRLVTPDLVRRYTDLSRAPGHRRILLAIDQGVPASDETLRAIRIPTLVMVGEDDHLIPAADGRRFASAIPGAQLIGYPGVGHVPMEQIPDRSAADLQRWMAESVEGGGVASAPPPGARPR